MKEIKLEACPFCGGTELLETRMDSYGSVYLSLAERNGWHCASVYATVCRDCGSIVRSYCKNPEKLFPKKERKS